MKSYTLAAYCGGRHVFIFRLYYILLLFRIWLIGVEDWGMLRGSAVLNEINRAIPQI